MLKRILLLAGLLAAAPVYAAGTVPGFSLTPQFDTLAKVAPGCKLYVIQAGTTSTPQNAYQDTALSILQTNPIVCDSTGRLPQWFVADGTIKLRLTDRNGNQLFVGDNLLVVGPSSGGGGGGGTVDPTTILQTGDFKQVYGTGVVTGFVRANGRTIGSATSGATERANADTQALFVFLWGADPNLSVSGGRGASAAADFAANKTIALPDARGRVLAGLDGMGAPSASRISGAIGTSDTLGSVGGGATVLSAANLPPYTPSGSITNGAISATNVIFSSIANGGQNAISTSSTGTAGGNLTTALGLSQATSTFTGSAQGGTSTPFLSVQPTILATIYIKL